MKIPDIGFPLGTHPTIYEFYEWTRSVVNEGRYQLRVIDSAPDWTTNDGEMLCVNQPDVGKFLYMFITDQWYAVPLTTAGVGGLVPTGVILPYGGVTTAMPSGWALCNGALVDRVQYVQLFGVIGIQYGAGDGSTTFNLPDMRGRYPLGCDSGAGRCIEPAASTVGLGGGSQYLQAHQHNFPAYATVDGPFPPYYGGFGPSTTVYTSVEGAGGSQNMPPYQTTLYIIKL